MIREKGRRTMGNRGRPEGKLALAAVTNLRDHRR